MRKYGQHFLINQGVVEQIVCAAISLLPGRLVEIGPGKGALTTKLIAAGAAQFTVVEIDPEMVLYLQEHLPPAAGIDIVEANFLAFNLAALPPVETVFVSNLPYIDAAEILDKTLAYPYFKAAVYMFQKEQANRILAAAGTEFYGPLSILSQVRSVPVRLCQVGKGSFNPPPKVDSTVLVFTRPKEPLFKTEKEFAKFERLVKSAFSHKRKTMFNSLVLSGYEAALVKRIFETAGMDFSVRAEQVAVAAFLALTRAI